MRELNQLRKNLKEIDAEIQATDQRLRSLRETRATYQRQVDTIEATGFLKAHDALDLIPGAELSLCEALYEHRKPRGDTPAFLQSLYGRGDLCINSLDTETGEFRISSGGISVGGIPLLVIRAMRDAWLEEVKDGESREHAK